DLRELLALAQLRDALLELVHTPTERGRLAGVARRAVATRELVQVVEQRAGIAHVATDGGVRPAHAIRVEAQVQLDETGDVVDEVVRVTQREQPLAGHPRADDLVVVKGDALRSVPAGAGLADVVEER